MLRVVVEERGKRRAFRLGEGVLTVGSGAEARLRLESPDVALVHVEVHLREGVARLRALPGVVPPRLGQRPIEGEKVLPLRQPVELGSARLWLEAAEGELQGPLETSAAGADPVDRAIQREKAIARSMEKPRRSVVKRTRPVRSQGMPGWLLALLIVAGLGAGAWFFSQGLETSAETRGQDAVRATLKAAADLMEAGNFTAAAVRLDQLPEGELSEAQKEQIGEMRAEMVARREQSLLDVENMKGTQYLDVLLIRYEKRYLSGEPERPKVRLFLKRCQEFRERWPQHPRLDWVERQEQRFAGFMGLDERVHFEDIDWEIQALVGTSPRNYKRSFELIEEFLPGASPNDEEEALALRSRLEAEREEYHTDRLHQAEYEYDRKKNPVASVWWLVHSVIWLGDEAMEDEAAQILLKMPRLDEHLRGYQSEHPAKFEALMEHPEVASYARSKGLL